MKLSKSAKEVLIRMQKENREFIYIGVLGIEGFNTMGMCIVHKIRRGTASNLIKNGLAEEININKVKLTELGKTIKLD